MECTENSLKFKLKISIIPPMESGLNIDIKHMDGIEYLKTITKNSVDLILTDPPYCISKDTGMEKHKKLIDNIDLSGKNTKTEIEWDSYKAQNNITTDDKKDNYIKYGTIYGKKYGVTTDYGDWDKDFSLDKLAVFLKEFYAKLRNGGTCIIFFDLWKITQLKELMENVGFKQIRVLEWIKTNPQPLNSKLNYLTNCLGVLSNHPSSLIHLVQNSMAFC